MEEQKKEEKSKPNKKLLSSSESSESEQEKETKPNNTLYDLMNVTRTATLDEIKKQYKILALKLHPDKNSGTEEAKANFQKMNEAYSILSDPRKRQLYDDTGLIEDGNMDDFEAAYNFFRGLYKKVETEDITNFEAKYKNSQEEIDDLIEFYNKNKGDITLILQEIILSQNCDIDRFLQIYDKLIEEGQIKSYQNYNTSRNEIKMLPDESKKAKKSLKKKQNDLHSLEQQILAKHQNGAISYLDKLEAKYKAQKKKKVGKQQKKLDDTDDQQFGLNKKKKARKQKVN